MTKAEDSPRCYICNISNNEFLEKIVQQKKNSLENALKSANEKVRNIKKQESSIKQNNETILNDIYSLPIFLRNMEIQTILNERDNLIKEFPILDNLLKLIKHNNRDSTFEVSIKKVIEERENSTKNQNELNLIENNILRTKHLLETIDKVVLANLNQPLRQQKISLPNFHCVKQNLKSLDALEYLHSKFFIDFSAAIPLLRKIYDQTKEFLEQNSDKQIMQDQKLKFADDISYISDHRIIPDIQSVNKIIELYRRNRGEIDSLDELLMAMMKLDVLTVHLCPICQKIYNKSEEKI